MIEKLSGQYTYGEPYPDNMKGTSVPFEIEWSLIDGIISGTCVDDKGKEVFNEPATINGFVDEGIISFIKKYPKYWEIDEDGVSRVFDHLPPPEIHYSGVLVDNHFEGDWEMIATYILENGEIEQLDCTGTWTLYRNDLKTSKTLVF
ncbi:MAG: hypothetical protein V4556_07445 [Bacteroidota bacterium]